MGFIKSKDLSKYHTIISKVTNIDPKVKSKHFSSFAKHLINPRRFRRIGAGPSI